MSVDRTLRIKSGVASSRNVLRRAERIAAMTDKGTFDPEATSPLGLPKTRVKGARKASAKPAGEKAAAAEGAEKPSEA
ncbi:MAG: small basic protein [Planctomycetes bacterium]|nr:small basic protein [Planctomycetota bacterium]